MENEKSPIKIRLTTVVLLFIIVALIITLALVFAYYNQNDNEPKVSEQTTQNTTNLDDKKLAEAKKEENKELDVNSEQIKKLYTYIPVFNTNKLDKNAYQSSAVTKDKISEEYLLAHAFNNLEIPDSEKEQVMDADGKTPMQGWYKFAPNILQEKVKEMYGKNIGNKTFGIGYGKGCNYENGKYLYGAGGGSDEQQINIRSIIEAYEKDGDICIEDKFICLKIKAENENLYASTDSNEPLGVDYYKTTGMLTYRHTFKKNAEGNYYWYSTEPVK